MNGKAPDQKVWAFHTSEKNGKVGAYFVHAVAFKLACLCIFDMLCLANLKAAWLEETIISLCLDRFFMSCIVVKTAVQLFCCAAFIFL